MQEELSLAPALCLERVEYRRVFLAEITNEAIAVIRGSCFAAVNDSRARLHPSHFHGSASCLSSCLCSPSIQK